jgi:hypothetical protein
VLNELYGRIVLPLGAVARPALPAE